MSKESLLFLCHRIPFPPNKGDKIRSFNMLKALSKDFDIHLGSFVDDPYDWQYADTLDDYCASKLLLNQNKFWCKVKGLKAFLTGDAISVPYYFSGEMEQWVTDTLAEHKISKVFVYSSVMAQYINERDNLHTVIDFVDVDSDKWRQYSEGKSGLSSWLYGREYKTLQEFEGYSAERAHYSLFVSPQEAELFKQQVQDVIKPRVRGMLNGVDTDYFDPQEECSDPLANHVDVVFTGAMDYWANVDAVLWFAKHVWPLVKKRQPDATFFIVGGNPTQEVMALDGKSGIKVTGRVKDVRPFIKYSKVAVAPLQIARGIQNKVLEALSMAKPVVATTMAIEGIEARTDNIKITDSPEETAKYVVQYLEQFENAPENRQWILENLQWKYALAGLKSLFKKS